MNYLGQGQPPPMPYPPPKKTPLVVFIILGVFALLAALAVGGGIRAFHAVKEDSAGAIAVGNSFIDNMGQHNFADARTLFTPQVQGKTSADDLKDVETLTEKHHGAFIAHGQPQWSVQNWNGQTSVRLTYPAQFTKSDSTISMVVVETGGDFRVYEAHYEF